MDSEVDDGNLKILGSCGRRVLETNTTLSFSQEVACSADLQLHAPHWPEANKPHGNRLSHANGRSAANREGGMCEDILVDKVVLIKNRVIRTLDFDRD